MKTIGGARPFEERAKEFEEAIKPISERLGVGYAATLQANPQALVATLVVHNLWESPKG